MKDDAKIVEQYHRFAWRIATHVFDGSPVDILLVDPDGTPQHRLSWDRRPPDPLVTAGGQGIHRFGRCTDAEIKATSEVLAEFLATRSGAELEVACDERIELSILHDQADPHAVPIAELSHRAFADRPVDLALYDGKRKQIYAQAWEDRPPQRKTK